MSTLLEQLVESLNLSSNRDQVTHCASSMTPTDSSNAGWITMAMEEVAKLQLEETILTTVNAATEDVLGRLANIKARYFSVPAVASQSTSRTTASGSVKPGMSHQLRIPVSTPSNIDCTLIKTRDQCFDAINSAIIHYVSNAAQFGEGEVNPFEILSNNGESSHDSKPQKTDDPLQYPYLCVERLADRHVEDTHDRQAFMELQASWFYSMLVESIPDGLYSEMTVQHMYGSLIRHAFGLPNCQIWSDRKINFPTAIAMSTGASNPDFATRQVLTKASASGDFPGVESPVLLVGEAKRTTTGQHMKPAENKPYFTCQMQPAVYTTLLLLILLYLKGQRFRGVASIQDNGRLPPDFFVYGIYYDESSLIIYAHLPILVALKAKDPSRDPEPEADGFDSDDSEPEADGFDSDDSSEPEADADDSERDPVPVEYGWRFLQVKMKTFIIAHPNDDEKTAARRRISLGIALRAVREHTRRLFEIFSTREYLDLCAAIKA